VICFFKLVLESLKYTEFDWRHWIALLLFAFKMCFPVCLIDVAGWWQSLLICGYRRELNRTHWNWICFSLQLTEPNKVKLFDRIEHELRDLLDQTEYELWSMGSILLDIHSNVTVLLSKCILFILYMLYDLLFNISAWYWVSGVWTYLY